MHNFRNYNPNKFKIIKEIPLDIIKKWSHRRRFKVFASKGTKCVRCGRNGTRIFNWLNIKNNQQHTDLYLETGELMTVDHIIPRAKGGSNELSNLQPMCYECNNEKGDKTNALEWLNFVEFIIKKEYDSSISLKSYYLNLVNTITEMKKTCQH